MIRVKPSSEVFADFGAETVPVIEEDLVVGYEVRLNDGHSFADSKLADLVHHELAHIKLREMGYPIYAVDPNSLAEWFREEDIGYFAKLIDLPNEYYTILLSIRYDAEMGWAYVNNLANLSTHRPSAQSLVKNAVAVADAVAAKKVCLDYNEEDFAANFESIIRRTSRSSLIHVLRAAENALFELPPLPLNRFSPRDIDSIEEAYGAIGASLLPTHADFVITTRKIQNSQDSD
jgi:hypothetical protein